MNYSSNVIFKEGYTDIQTIYASQIYDTFFGVFASFHVSNITNESDKKLLTKVEFHLINYKGPLNVELFGNFDRPTKVSNEFVTGYRFGLKIGHTVASKAYQDKITLDLSKMYAGDGGLKFSDGDFFIVERKTIPLAGENSNINDPKNNAFVNGVFDSEFYIRDGAYGIPRNQIDYDNGDNLMFDPPGQLGNGSCTPANNLIRFEN